MDEDVLSSVSGTYKPVTLRPGEVFTHSFKYRTRPGPYCPAGAGNGDKITKMKNILVFLQQMLRRMVEVDRICARTHAEYVRVRLVGSGLGSSPGFMGLLSLSQTRLPSLKKGKESCRGVRGDVRGSRGSVGSEEPASDILTR